jgi:hypothetical protein
MKLTTLKKAAARCHLTVIGAFHPKVADNAPSGTCTLILLGPYETGFWAHFSASPEMLDGQPDPLDRWSKRVVTPLASELGGTAVFPFGGPPYQPFIAWALRSQRCWVSPSGLLVHDKEGLFVSFRGAIALPIKIDLPPPPPPPCQTCIAEPCRSSCPVGALKTDSYDVAACKADLDRPENDCMTRGCASRRACPISQRYGRVEAQSAFHMAAFK